MHKIVALKSFIERHLRRGCTGGIRILPVVAALLVAGLAWSAPPSPPPLVQIRPDNQLVDLLNRIERLEDELRRLRGELELYRHQQQDLARRLQTLEKSGSAEAPATEEPAAEPATESETIPLQPAAPIPPPTATPPPLSLPPGAASQPRVISSAPTATPVTRLPPPPASGAPLTPEEQSAYSAAFNTLREGRYEEAISQLQGFLARYPSSALAGDAQYWLGESYYVLREFERAKQAFLSLGIDHPDSGHLADAMLRLGYIYDDAGDKTKAREVLQKLIETYPDSRAAGLARQRLQTLR